MPLLPAVGTFVIAALVALLGYSSAEPFLGNGPGTINQLSPFTTSGGQVRLASTTADFRVPSLGSEDCVGTDANGVFQSGTCGAGGSGTVSTSTNETKGRLPYWTSTSGTPATLGEVATTSLTINAPLTTSGTAGALVGGTNLTIDIDDIKAADLDLSDITLNDFTNDSNFITDGNTNWDNSYGFTTFAYLFPSNATSTHLNFTGGASTTNLTVNNIWGTTNGGSITIDTLDAITSGTSGGSLTLSAGNGVGLGVGGAVSLTAGDGGASGSSGGDVSVLAGRGRGSEIGTKGGDLILGAGDGTGGSAQGDIKLRNPVSTSFYAILNVDSLTTTNRSFTFPNADGTFCLIETCATFSYPFPSNATTTLLSFNGGASTTLLSANYASSTLYYGAGLADCNTGNMLTWTAGRFGCEDDTSSAGGGAFPFTATATYNSTSTPIGFLQGLFSTASSTFNSTLNLPALSAGGLGVNGLGVVYSTPTTTFSGGLTYSNGNVTADLGTSIDISDETNLTAGDALTITGDDIDFDGGTVPAGALGGTWASPTVDDDGHNHTGTTISGLDISGDTNLTAGDGLTLTDDDLDCDTASASAFGCLSTTNWSTFNNKISSTSLSAGSGISYNSTTGVITNTIAYPFPSNATTTLINFNGGLSSASTTLTGPFVFANATGTNATTTSLAVLNLTAASCDVKSSTTGVLSCGTDATGSGAFPFTSTTNYGAVANSTSTPIWFTTGLQASSTNHFVYASTTALTVSGSSYFGSATGIIIDDLNNIFTENGAAPGSIAIFAGNSTSNSEGGDIVMDTGDGNGAFSGGDYDFTTGTGGATGDGGNMFFAAGPGGATSGNGGALSFAAGDAQNGNSNGGDVLFVSGNAAGAGTDGKFKFEPGNNTIQGILDFSSLASSDKTFTFPNKSLTFAGITNETHTGATLASTTLTGNFVFANATGTNATTTSLAVTGTASTTNFYGANLSECSDAGDTLNWNAGLFSCGSDAEGAGGGSFPFSADTNYNQVVYSTSTPTLWFKSGFFASSTSHLVNYYASNGTTTNATSTTLNVSGQVDFDGLTSALVLTGTGGILAEYAGTSCTNQFVRSLDAVGAATCATVGTADVSGLDISADTNLTAGDNLTLTDDDIDLDAVITGITSIAATAASTTNATIAGFFQLPTAASFSNFLRGALYYDTSAGNLLMGTTTTTHATDHVVIASATTTLYSFVVASTSPDLKSGGVINLPAHFLEQKVIAIICDVDGGTSVVGNLSNEAGSSDTNQVTCTTTSTQFAINANSTFAAYAVPRLEVGTVTGAVDYLSIRIIGYRTTD